MKLGFSVKLGLSVEVEGEREVCRELFPLLSEEGMAATSINYREASFVERTGW
jgi:hypothetical protein